ncbi:MAG: response regulator [Gammaproteobacteria bacterium]|nr:response regulator [Gammaproteobacteria bacterium]
MNEQGKILIIDDIKANVELLEALLLSRFGFIILKAYGGKEGLELAKKEHPDLILLDIMMPDLDGFQVCEKLRQDTAFDVVPIIMVTAKDKDDDIVQSLEKGADDYIIKPINKEDLYKKVSSLLAKAKKGELPSQFYLEKLRAQKDEKDK